jgi:hypothetical protein
VRAVASAREEICECFLAEPVIRRKVECWACVQTSNAVWKRQRNAWARLLLQQLRAGRLEEPFNTAPPDGTLPALPKHITYSYSSPRSPHSSPPRFQPAAAEGNDYAREPSTSSAKSAQRSGFSSASPSFMPLQSPTHSGNRGSSSSPAQRSSRLACTTSRWPATTNTSNPAPRAACSATEALDYYLQRHGFSLARAPLAPAPDNEQVEGTPSAHAYPTHPPRGPELAAMMCDTGVQQPQHENRLSMPEQRLAGGTAHAQTKLNSPSKGRASAAAVHSPQHHHQQQPTRVSPPLASAPRFSPQEIDRLVQQAQRGVGGDGPARDHSGVGRMAGCTTAPSPMRIRWACAGAIACSSNWKTNSTCSIK